MPAKINLDQARRIALAAQGFAQKRPAGAATARQFSRVMRQLGLIQLDSVNVCVRSHYMPFFSRLGRYDQARLDDWLNTRGRHFEYWAHEASVMPVECYPLWRWRMRQWQPWKNARDVMRTHPQLRRQVLQQIEEQGPLTVRELGGPRGPSKPWWGRGPAKLVAETLFGAGELTALRGEGFTRLYDLPQRAIPEAVRTDERYDERSAQKELLRRATRHLGVGTAKDIADYHRLKITTARPLLAELAAQGQIDEVRLPGCKGPAYRDPAARCPRRIDTATLLSPFDPLVWYRERAERLFDFHYRIEIYTPEHKRRHGYYVLPFLQGGELVARVDLKADRNEQTLRVPSAFVESGRDKTHVARALASELERLASWLGLKKVALGRKGNLIGDLRSKL